MLPLDPLRCVWWDIIERNAGVLMYVDWQLVVAADNVVCWLTLAFSRHQRTIIALVSKRKFSELFESGEMLVTTPMSGS